MRAALARVWQRHFWQIGDACAEDLGRRLRPGMRTLETGSGRSTLIFEEHGCRHVALEHAARYAAPCRSVVLAPLVGEPAWYDWHPTAPFDLILIDGPPFFVGREGILRVLDQCMTEQTVIFVDDTQRGSERRLAERIAHDHGRTLTTSWHRALGLYRRAYSVLEPRREGLT